MFHVERFRGAGVNFCFTWKVSGGWMVEVRAGEGYVRRRQRRTPSSGSEESSQLNPRRQEIEKCSTWNIFRGRPDRELEIPYALIGEP